ncbi:MULTISPECIES: TonB-dependent siderophore receptor [unclassified Lentimicrobium]|uniref:TonB-dependent receptor plug domain-containing protein n=1 Tax=unclassified Lentimicrobium TaxID=2677434 RepID=UPI0015548594|nr:MULTISPECIES: TonB-dependent receptor [unclassified Lentimicrobium]NPD44138.1 TonB-dependent receptor [Lentimicrobium sp. S6]NPD83268.1 TonB-dependent receptor [Lentimicrobium sp. L6]
MAGQTLLHSWWHFAKSFVFLRGKAIIQSFTKKIIYICTELFSFIIVEIHPIERLDYTNTSALKIINITAYNRRLFFKIFAFLSVSLFWSQNINAQITKDTFQLKTVEVKAQKPIEEVAMSKSRIDTMALQSLSSKSLSSLMTASTPVFIKSYGRGSSATASFRGTAASHTQVNWNGMSLNSPMRGDVDFSQFPVYFIDRVELLHGGSSLSAGSGALGGSISLENKADWSNRISVKYIQHIESFSTFKEFAELALGNSKFQSKTRVFHDQSENDFPFYNYGVLPYRDDVQKNADYEKYGFLQEFYGKLKKNHLLSLKIWGHHNFRNLPQLMSYEGYNIEEIQTPDSVDYQIFNRIEYREDEQLRAIGAWKYYIGDSRWEFTSGINYTKLHYFRKSTELDNNFNSISKEKSSFNHLEYQYKEEESLHFKTSLDANFHQVDIYDSTKKTGYKEERVELSYLAQLNLQINERTSAYALLRSEYYDDTFVFLIPSLGIEYQLDQKDIWSIKFNASRNYHKPNLNDLYWIPGGNPDLLPEDGYTAELGLGFKQAKNNWNLESNINIYASIIENWIVWHPSSTGAIYWEADNIKKVFARGVECTLKYNMDFYRNWKLKTIANYALTITTNENAVESVDESRGKQLIYIPRHTANLMIGVNYKSWELNIDNSIIGKRYTTSSNELSDFEKPLLAYSLTNLSFEKGFNWKKLKARFGIRVENIFDRDYMTVLWRAMPGRYYSVNLQIGWRK